MKRLFLLILTLVSLFSTSEALATKLDVNQVREHQEKRNHPNSTILSFVIFKEAAQSESDCIMTIPEKSSTVSKAVTAQTRSTITGWIEETGSSTQEDTCPMVFKGNQKGSTLLWKIR